MNIKKLVFIFAMALLLFGIVSCANPTLAPETTQAVLQSEEPAPATAVEPTPTDSPEPTQEPTESPNETAPDEPEAQPVSDGIDHCVECHTDQEMLIDTAKPVEEVESENEGAG